MDTGAPPLVLQEAPVPPKPADDESEESSSESSSSSSSQQEPEPLPSNPAVSQQAERIRAVRLESSESEGKPSGPFSPPKDPRPRLRNKAAREEPPRKAAKPEPPHFQSPGHPRHQRCLSRGPHHRPQLSRSRRLLQAAEAEPTAEATGSGDPATQAKPEPTELEEGDQAADGAFVVVKDEPDYSEDEPLPQADPPAAASWVFVRDLLDEAAADPEAPTSPAQAPEEAAAATADSFTGAGGPAEAGGTAPAGSTAESTLGSTIESLGVSEGSLDGDPAAECDDTAAGISPGDADGA